MHYMAEVTVHGHVELGIVVMDRDEKTLNGNIGVQLLTNLTTQRLFRRLTSLYLSSGKFPPSFVVSVTALRGKILVATMDDGGNNLDVFSFHGMSDE
jgi:hypothetical protein